MSNVLTSPLQKSIPALTPSLSTEKWEETVSAFIGQKEMETFNLISRLDSNITILEDQKDKATQLISILEEAGGLTVRARNLMATPEDIIKYDTKIKEFAEWFHLAREKFDTASAESAFQGINLMNGDHLETVFDAKGQNKLVTEGIKLTCAELGIRDPNFETLFSVQNARIDVMNAIDIVMTVRNTISAHIATLVISRDFAYQSIELAKSVYPHLANSNLMSETAALKKLSDLGDKILGDEQMADTAQQEILKSFAASPNMEEI